MYFALDTSAHTAAVISGGPDHKVCLWHVDDYVTPLSAVEAGGTAGPATAGKGGSAVLQARSVYSGHTACVEDVCFNPQSSDVFASVGDDRMLFVWDARAPSFSSSSTASAASTSVHTGHTDDVNGVSWNPVHSQLMLTASSDSLVHLIDVRMMATGAGSRAAGASHGKHVLRVYRGHERDVKNVSWAPDGVHFASSGDDAAVNVWSAAAELQAISGASSSLSPSYAVQQEYHELLATETGTDVALRFRHWSHPTAVQSAQWNPHHPPGLTIASVHGDSGGQMQIWRMNEALWELDAALGGTGLDGWNAAVKEWRKRRKKEADDAAAVAAPTAVLPV